MPPPDAPPNPPVLRDQLDRQLLALLQANARASASDLARQLGTARTTVLSRLARLERDGVVAGYTVRLAQDLQNQGLQAFVGLSVEPRAGRRIETQLERMPEVRQLCAVSGEVDYMLLLRADSASRLNALLDEIRTLEGVLRTTTSVALAWKIERG